MNNFSQNDWRSYQYLCHGRWQWPDGKNSSEYNAWYYRTHPDKWIKDKIDEAVVNGAKWIFNKAKGVWEKAGEEEESEYVTINGANIPREWLDEPVSKNPNKPKLNMDTSYNPDDWVTDPESGIDRPKTAAEKRAEAVERKREEERKAERKQKRKETAINVGKGLVKWILHSDLSDDVPQNDFRRYTELRHHGIMGMHWGIQNGPPYPLEDGDHSASEKRAGWRQSLSGDSNSFKGRHERAKEAEKTERQIRKLDSKIEKAQTKGNSEKAQRLTDERAQNVLKSAELRRDLTPEEIDYGKRMYDLYVGTQRATYVGGPITALGYGAYRAASGKMKADNESYREAQNAYAKKTGDYKMLVKNTRDDPWGGINRGDESDLVNVANRILTKEQKDRIINASNRLDQAYNREENSKDPKMEKARDQWAENQARAAVQRELNDPHSGLRDESKRTIEKTIESYKYDHYYNEWDKAHPEYTNRNSRQESWEAAFGNYKNELNTVSRELLGDKASDKDIQKSYYGLDAWRRETSKRR